MKAILAFFGLVFVFGFICVSSYISAANFGNSTEQSLKATLANNQNIYAQGTQKVMEVAQVPEMYRNDLTKVVTAEIQGRYGANGSQATFQMLKEQNPTLDPAMYIKIQQIIQSFRDEFQNSQTAMLDKVRSYQTSLGNVWSGFWLHLAGYPKINFDDYQIVTTDKAAAVFKSHRDSGIQLPQ